jgi:hypothetical protein
MDTQKATEFGMNRTGTKYNLDEAIKTAEGAKKLTSPPKGDGLTVFCDKRMEYIRESDAVGTVPTPTTLKGMLSSLMEKMKKGDHSFIDKLGERIAFERTGTRLYEALIAKYEGSSDKANFPDLTIIKKFHQEELSHFRLCCEAMEEIGGDPTAVTPSADVAGVAAAGWVQALGDPRINFKQSLEVILQAELVDNDCWDVLIEMAEDLGLNTLVEKFQTAKIEEDVHLSSIRSWVKEMNLAPGTSIESSEINRPSQVIN